MIDVSVGNSSQNMDEFHKSIAACLEHTEAAGTATAASFDIQRRGQNYPGDVGHNFGLNDFGFNPLLNPFGMFDTTDHRNQNGFNPLGFTGNFTNILGIQGSNAALAHTTKLAHYKMAMCVSAYKGFGVAKNVIDLMACFASEGLQIRHPDKTIQRFYQRWAKQVGLQKRVTDIARQYYKCCNVFIYTTMGTIEPKAYERMRRARAVQEVALADSNDPAEPQRESDILEETQKPLEKREIPWRYTLLNPFQMELRGSKYFGQSRWVFKLDETTTSEINSGAINSSSNGYIDFLDQTDCNLPPEFPGLLNKPTDEKPAGETRDANVVELNQARLWTMHYMKDDHEDWADPILWPVMADIFYKNKLRQMDISVCNSIINAVTIFKLGRVEEGIIPKPEHLKKFSELLRTPTQAMNMVWNDAISIESSYPPVDKILNIAKYESVDKDILRGLGIPDVLLGGSSSNFSVGFLGVRTLLERLEEGRAAILEWLNSQFEIIAATLGHKRLPTVRFGKMSLRDETAEKQLVLGLLDRNVISIEAVLNVFGEDFEIELERMREESKIRETEGLLEKHGPYTDPMLSVDEQEEQNSPTPLAGPPKKKGAPNGRPKNSKGVPQKKKRVTKPKGMASAHAKLMNIRRTIVDVLGDIDGVDQMTCVVGSHLYTRDSVSVQDIQDVLVKSNFINEDLVEHFNSLRKDFHLIDAMAGAIGIHGG